jgi:hypothetical protein
VLYRNPPETPNSKQCMCRSTVDKKNSLEWPEPRKKPRFWERKQAMRGGQSSSGCAGWRL